MTEAIETIRIDTLGSDATLGPIVAAMTAASEAERALGLDFTPLERAGAEHRRVAMRPSLLLANLLTGAFGRLTLKVTWPSAAGICASLERSGLAFALAQRRGVTSFVGDPPRKWGEWKKDWRPSTESLWDEFEAAQIERRTYAYINPHRLGRGHFRGYHEGAALPWLRKMIPVPKDPSAQKNRESFVSLAERAVVELNENFPLHAFDIKGNVADRSEWLFPAEIDGSSLVTCSLTKGGANSWNRLYLLALDNGYGIGRTMRWQHPQLSAPVSELVETILKKQLRQRGIPGHNGIGLWWLYDLACTSGGTIEIITEDDLDPSGSSCVVVHVTFDDDRYAQDVRERRTDTSVTRLAVPVRGTIVNSILQVPKTGDDMWVRPLAGEQEDDPVLVH